VAARSKAVCSQIIDCISKKFEIHIVTSQKFLAIEYHRNKDGFITLHQASYIECLLERFGMADCNPTTTPFEPGNLNAQSTRTGPTGDYREVLGSLQYAASKTRPDIAQAVNYLSRHAINPTNIDWCVLKRVLRYLSGTKQMAITYRPKGNREMIAYCDANFAGDPDNYRSTSG